jgi:hypothetical protein
MNEIKGSDTAWILVATALVLVMTPGLALFYGGMVRAKLELTIDIRRGRTTASADRVQHEPLVVHVRDVERLARHTVADGEDAGREELQLGFRGVRRILEEPQAVTFTLNQYMAVVTGAMHVGDERIRDNTRTLMVHSKAGELASPPVVA